MKRGMVRIIAGKWRGRRLRVLESVDLRPTPDRVRETLFNWLMPYIVGARCLDLFAGSGVLGFEALSRGAAHVTLVDQVPEVVKLLQDELTLFKADGGEVLQREVPLQLQKPAIPYNIVFLDPPFQSDLLPSCCDYLERQHFLAELAYIYLEAPINRPLSGLPKNWEIVKASKAGEVAFYLAKRTKNI